MLLLGGVVVVESVGDGVVVDLCFLPFLWAFFVVVVVVDVVVCEVLDCDALLWGWSEIELVEPFGFVWVAVPGLGVWSCGVGVVWLCCGVAVLIEDELELGFVEPATLAEDCPVALLDKAGDALCAPLAAPVTPPVVADDTPGPSCADGLHESAMCFKLVTVKVLPVAVEDCV